MRALKALVAVLTLLLLIGFAGLIWGIVRQAEKLTPAEKPAPMAPAEAPAVVADERMPWQALLLNEPAGTRIASVTSAGDLVILHLYTGAPGQDERLVVVDPGNGVRLGTVTITGKP